MHLQQQDTTETARQLIKRHGLRAQAIALERVQDMRVQGDAAGLNRWQAVYAAVCELRRSSGQRVGPEEPYDYRS